MRWQANQHSSESHLPDGHEIAHGAVLILDAHTFSSQRCGTALETRRFGYLLPRSAVALNCAADQERKSVVRIRGQLDFKTE